MSAKDPTLSWLVISGLSGKVKKNNEIGALESWGPQFRVSFDLKINRHVTGDKKWGWSEVLAFSADGKTKGSKGNLLVNNKMGERIPAIFIHRQHKPWGMYIANNVNKNRDYHFRYTNYTEKKWHRFEISQLREGDGKVGYQSLYIIYLLIVWLIN